MATLKPKRAREVVTFLGYQPDEIITIAQQAMRKAAREAVAENDALGIATSGSSNGKIVFRRPRLRGG